MKLKLTSVVIIGLFLMLFFSNIETLQSSSSQPPSGYASVPPAFTSCISCHGGAAQNATGKVNWTFSGASNQYTAGTMYSMTVTLTDGQPRGGFEATATDSSTLGAFYITNTTSTTKQRSGLTQWIGHKTSAFRTWTFNWKAPTTPPANGRIVLYASVMGAGGSTSNSGDTIYRDSLVLTQLCVQPTVPAVSGTNQFCQGSSTILTAGNTCSGCTYSWSNSTAGTSTSAITAATYFVTATNSCGTAVSSGYVVTQLPKKAGSITTSICQGKSYLFNGVNRTFAGTYLDTLVASNGCDSILTLNLSVKAKSSSLFSKSICQGQSFFFNGANRTVAGAYLDTLVNANGCDSLLTLNLNVLTPKTASIAVSVCSGKTYSFNGKNIGTAGIYKDTVTGTNACDSITTLTLSVASFSSFSQNAAICQGESYLFNNRTLTAAGIYSDTIKSAGCDSISILNLTVKSKSLVSISGSICKGDLYMFNGKSLTTGGIYTDTVQGASGCDSVVTLTLTENPLPIPTITQNQNILSTQTFTGYQWLDAVGLPISNETAQTLHVAQAGIYSVIVTDSKGCTDTSNEFTVLGINDEIPNSIQVRLYPNPSAGTINLAFDESGDRTFEISDEIGRIIYNTNSSEKSVTIDIPSFSNSIYYLHIKEDGKSRSLRFSVIK